MAPGLYDVPLGKYQVKIVVADSTTQYIGKAQPGVVTSDAGWQILRLVQDTNGNLELKYADGTPAFVNVMDDAATYTYS